MYNQVLKSTIFSPSHNTILNSNSVLFHWGTSKVYNQDLTQMHNKKGSQIDIAVLEFSKAFDTVPHDGLLSKLMHYDKDEKMWLWIYNFL